MMKKTLFAIFMIFLSACGMTSNVVKEPFTKTEVYFCPYDMCQEKIIELIDSSSEIKCAFYELGLPELIEKLKEKNAEVVMEDKNVVDPFLTGYSFALMHNKFCVFDRKLVWTGSFNPTERGNYFNNENAIVIESSALAENYLEEFDELKRGEYGKGEKVNAPIIYLGDMKIENYFCPEDSCKLHVINALKAANKSIYFMTFSFSDEDIGNLLWNKDYEGLDVKGILEERQLGDYSRYDDLKEFSIIDKNPYTMHHKVFIIDNSIVITGSYNPTKNANENNDENILIIHDEEIAKKYAEEFDRVFNFDENDFLGNTNIIITKVVYDVPGSDEGNEYVELKNMGEKDELLDYYFLSNNKTNSRLKGIIKSKETMMMHPSFSLPNKKGIVQLKKYFYVIDTEEWGAT